MTLGPVAGNRYASAHKSTPKPELQQRLNEQAQRKTVDGTFKVGADGRTTFVPKLIEDAAASDRHAAAQQVRAHNAKVLEHMRAIEPQGNSLKIGDRLQRVGGTINNGCFGVVDKIDEVTFHVAWESNPSGDNGWWLISAREKCFENVSPGQSSALAQIAEPGQSPVVECKQARRLADALDLAYAATITPLLPRAEAKKLMGMVQESFAVLGMTQAELAQVMATPTNVYTCDLRHGDEVEVVTGQFAGQRGRVSGTQHGAPMVAFSDSVAVKFQRVNVRLLSRALPL